MVLLYGDVARLCTRAIDLVLLLDYNRRKTSPSGRVTKNIANVVSLSLSLSRVYLDA